MTLEVNVKLGSDWRSEVRQACIPEDMDWQQTLFLFYAVFHDARKDDESTLR